MSCAEPAEIDQEFHADDVDQAEDQAEPQPDEDLRQGGREQDLAEFLRRRRAEGCGRHRAARAAWRRNPRPSCSTTGDSAGGEADDDDGQRTAPEQHQEQRIGQHQRRRGQGGEPGLERRRACGASDAAAGRAGSPTISTSAPAPSVSPAVTAKRDSAASSVTMRRSAGGNAARQRNGVDAEHARLNQPLASPPATR